VRNSARAEPRCQLAYPRERERMSKGDAAMTAQIFMRTREVRHATPLLAFIAGEFADAIGRVWRAPHGDFFALPAARRHAAAIAVAGLARREMSDGELRRLVGFARDAEVAAAIAGELATGFMRALAKSGETLWAREDYEAFLGLLREPQANEALRHMEEIRPLAFAPLVELPPALRLAPIIRVIAEKGAARDMALAFRLAVRMRTPDAAGRIVRRWGAGGEAHAVFRRVQEDLTPETFRAPDPAPRLPPAFARIITRKGLEAMALEFRNCLADQAQRIAEGRLSVWAWDAAPRAAVAFTWDVAGWRLAEAKGIDNAELPVSSLRELVRIVEEAGVRTGPSVTALHSRLDDWANGTTYAVRAGEGFIDQLALGDIWT
jgi:hypothetical protein